MTDIAVDQRRSTAAVIGDHLARRQAGEMEPDILENYLEWSASDREGRQLTAAVDSFTVRDGRIVFQSVHDSPPEARGWV